MSPLRLAFLAPLLILAAPAAAQVLPDAGSPADAGVAAALPAAPKVIQLGEDVGHHHHGQNDRVLLGGSILVKQGETVDDVVAVDGSVEVRGHVRGDAVAIGGPLHVVRGGHVDGDAVAVGGPLQLDEGAEVDGDHVVVGSGIEMGHLAGALGTLALAWRVVRIVVGLFGLIALGAVFIAFVPERLDRVKSVLVARPLPSLGAGLLGFISIVPACVLLVITIVGILVVPFLGLLFGLFVVFGIIVVAQLTGDRLLRGHRQAGPVVSLALGALILSAVRFVPILGATVMVVVMVIGLGAVLLSRAGSPRPGSGGGPLPASPSAPSPTAG